jgi:hypothetical protein
LSPRSDLRKKYPKKDKEHPKPNIEVKQEKIYFGHFEALTFTFAISSVVQTVPPLSRDLVTLR